MIGDDQNFLSPSNRSDHATNLTLNLTSSTLATYYYVVLRPLFSDDPMLCSTCLEIRSLDIGNFTPLMNGSLASVILLGQSYYWNNDLRQHLNSLEQQSLPTGKLKKWNRTSQFSEMTSGPVLSSSLKMYPSDSVIDPV